MERKIFILIISLLFISPFAFAETIKLKSGKTIEGKVVTLGRNFIELDVGKKAPVIYLYDEIHAIDGSPPSVVYQKRQRDVKANVIPLDKETRTRLVDKSAVKNYMKHLANAEEKQGSLLESFYTESPDPHLASKMRAVKRELNKVSANAITPELKKLHTYVNQYYDKLIEVFEDFEKNKVRNKKLLKEALELNEKVFAESFALYPEF